MKVLKHARSDYRPLQAWLIELAERWHCIFFIDESSPLPTEGLIPVFNESELLDAADLLTYTISAYTYDQFTTALLSFDRESIAAVFDVREFLFPDSHGDGEGGGVHNPPCSPTTSGSTL